MSQPEIPLWLLQTIIYAIVTGIVAPIVLKYFSKYLEKREEKRQKAKLERESREEELKTGIIRCKHLKESIDKYIKDGVENYKFEISGQYSPLGDGWGIAPTPLLQEKMKSLYRKVEECKEWREASGRALKLVIIEDTRSRLPKSIAKDPSLENMFETIITEPLIRGVKVNKSWFESEEPENFKAIMKSIEPPEDINRFFKEINRHSYNEHTLKISRRKREELISFLEDFKKVLDTEKERLETELRAPIT